MPLHPIQIQRHFVANLITNADPQAMCIEATPPMKLRLLSSRQLPVSAIVIHASSLALYRDTRSQFCLLVCKASLGCSLRRCFVPWESYWAPHDRQGASGIAVRDRRPRTGVRAAVGGRVADKSDSSAAPRRRRSSLL